MCGIFGVISEGKINQGICKYFKDASMAGVVRGVDSFGAFQVEKNAKGEIIPYVGRTLDSPSKMDSTQLDRIIRDVDTSMLTVGHNRAATHGVVNLDNCHPFTIYYNGNRVFGVHNGSLTSWNKVEDNETFDVDSKWALYMIAKHGTDFLNEIKGPFVFVWWDESNPDMVNIARGTGRPMHIAQTGTGNILFASEGGMLSWLAERNNIYLKNSEILEVPVNTLMSLDITNPNLSEANVSKIVPKATYTPPTTQSRNFSNFMGSSRYYDSNGYGWEREDEYDDDNYTYSRTRKISDLISSAVKKVKDKVNPTVTELRPQPERKGKHNLKISDGSIQLAEQLQLKGVEVTFWGLTYDDVRETMYGECLTADGEVMSHAVMVNVDQNLADALLKADHCMSKITGVTAYDAPGDDGIPTKENMTAMLSRPSEIVALDAKRAKEIDELMGKTSVTPLH